MSATDAAGLASSLERALPGVSDDQLPLRGNSFGEENTLDLIARAAGGTALELKDAAGALEVLSGPPKAEATELVAYLHGGAFAIHASGRASSEVS